MINRRLSDGQCSRLFSIEFSKIEIAPEVLSVIASIATSEIDGITGHFAELSKTNLEKISRKPL